MATDSILYERAEEVGRAERAVAPECVGDLRVDRIVDAITLGRDAYGLRPYFYAPLSEAAAVAYRHEVFADLEREPLRAGVAAFTRRMVAMRGHLAAAEQSSYRYQRAAWILEAVDAYCTAVAELVNDLRAGDPRSRGFRAVHARLAAYTGTAAFATLRDGATRLKQGLAAVRYCLLIRGGSVTVRGDHGEPDFSIVVEEMFARFRQGAAKDYRANLPQDTRMNHVEAMVLDRVAMLSPDLFAELEGFSERHADSVDPAVATFEREVQFYLAVLEYAERFRRDGLPFGYPVLTTTPDHLYARDCYDPDLAAALHSESLPVVRNDFDLRGDERVMVVTGPNQGGKTTFARVFGQLHYLAALGCPVPASAARLLLWDQLFTHFEREERITTLQGKLHDDLTRLRAIFEAATSASVVIVNEAFSSTSTRDAGYLGRAILERWSQLGAYGVWVTFLDELASFGPRTVSYVAGVDPADPAVRTYRLERRPADGAAYAMALARKHGLTDDEIRARLRP